ncbi:MAG TPA: hypothetical protein VFL91_21305 [Thermomicrobiales bacterium]|nr:hypothetical protein [Thermomicrobiales bacterium]
MSDNRDELKALLREILAETLAELRPSSAEITRNAKGEVQLAVKHYANSATEALEEAIAAFRRAEAEFPR